MFETKIEVNTLEKRKRTKEAAIWNPNQMKKKNIYLLEKNIEFDNNLCNLLQEEVERKISVCTRPGHTELTVTPFQIRPSNFRKKSKILKRN
jgi:hypothetical protein